MSASMMMYLDARYQESHWQDRLVRYVSYSCHPHNSSISLVYSSQIIPPENVDLRRARSNYTVHSSIHDDMYVASEYTSNANFQAGEHFQPDSSHDFITNGATTEEMTDTQTYIPGQIPNENHIQIDPSDVSTICESDYAPPAYHTIPSRTAFANSPFNQNLEPSTPA